MHSYLAQQLGSLIVSKRQKVGLLQKDLADHIGISAQFLGRIERGEVMIPRDGLISCIIVLQLSQNQINSVYRKAAALDVGVLFEDCRNERNARKKTC